MPNAANVANVAYTIERIYYYYYLLTKCSIQMSLNRCLRYIASMIIWIGYCSIVWACRMKIPPVNFSNYGSYTSSLSARIGIGIFSNLKSVVSNSHIIPQNIFLVLRLDFVWNSACDISAATKKKCRHIFHVSPGQNMSLCR